MLLNTYAFTRLTLTFAVFSRKLNRINKYNYCLWT